MPRHGQVWRWSEDELDRAAELLRRRRHGPSRHAGRDRANSISMWDIHCVNHDITQVRVHGQGLRNALLMTGRIVVVDRSNPRQYRYQVTDGQQAQRPTPAAD